VIHTEKLVDGLGLSSMGTSASVSSVLHGGSGVTGSGLSPSTLWSVTLPLLDIGEGSLLVLANMSRLERNSEKKTLNCTSVVTKRNPRTCSQPKQLEGSYDADLVSFLGEKNTRGKAVGALSQSFTEKNQKRSMAPSLSLRTPQT
jgi:hypothetical protein